MEVLYLHEHQKCFCYDHSERPQIETVAFKKGQCIEIYIHTNEVVFFMKGVIRYILDSYLPIESSAGQFIFLPCGGKLSIEAMVDSAVTVFRLNKPVDLCEGYPLEKLHVQLRGGCTNKAGKCHCPIGCLHINEPISYFLDGINRCLDEGLRCRYFYGLKIKELFLMLRAYYPKEELEDFLKPVLSGDTAFSEYIRANRDKYATVKQMAASLNLTPKVFAAKFKHVFGSTPYSWLKHEKVETIRRQLLVSSETFKWIAAENGFNTVQQFTNFCKKELGASPSQFRMEAIKDSQNAGK